MEETVVREMLHSGTSYLLLGRLIIGGLSNIPDKEASQL